MITPTPWKCSERKDTTICTEASGFIASFDTKEDRDWAVQCVNAYPKLLVALAKCLAVITEDLPVPEILDRALEQGWDSVEWAAINEARELLGRR